MTDVKWIKIVTDIFDDEKMLLIESLPGADSLIVIWFKLLCLAGKNNNNGVFLMNDTIAYTDEMLSTIFRRDVNTVRLALKTFEEFGMIVIIDGVITIPNWGKHQDLDKIEQRNEYMRKYMQEYRDKQRKKIECKSNSKVNSKVNVSEAEEELYKEEYKKDIYNNTLKKKKEKPRREIIPPELEWIKEYCKERNNNVDPQKFYDFYESKGWKVGKEKMKNWEASVRTWEKEDNKKQEPKPNGFNSGEFLQSTSYNWDEINAELGIK